MLYLLVRASILPFRMVESGLRATSLGERVEHTTTGLSA